MKGFGIRWRKWMRGCLSSVSFAVLVNGNAKGWVKASRGLRQGDPLSPLLFIIVADVLSRMLLKAEERNVLEGFKVGRNRTRVSHLQFADDTIFFSSSREEDMMTLKNVLLVFGHISGLKVNLDKSNIYGINLEQNHLSRLVEMLDCKASGWPILYLGLPLGGNPKTSGFWDPVIERISRRLDGWQKHIYLLEAELLFIQSCLTHMPCYFLSLFKIPASVATKIERMQRDFLWSGVGEGKRDHLVNWDIVWKWLWRYPREGSALWHQVILSIYGSHSNGWDVNNIVRWSHRCPWKAIALVYQEFSKFTRFVVGLFTVKSFFLALSQYSESPPIFPTKFVWNAQVPFKVKSFVWLVAHKKVNTNDLLQSRRPYKALSPDIYYFNQQRWIGFPQGASLTCYLSGKGVLTKSVGVIDANADIVFEVLLNLDRHQRYEWDMLTVDLELVDSLDGHYDIVYGTYDPNIFLVGTQRGTLSLQGNGFVDKMEPIVRELDYCD
ncbi:putative mitochondrial protein [Vitis vinifera]|uniref:Putative mitochondrial protein n=1 Tax=Vitis vinifera TaxID=29760 RepID=A0A438E7S8_VITVI|nr:putative mitochondrial protein [Vitis vinifera]